MTFNFFKMEFIACDFPQEAFTEHHHKYITKSNQVTFVSYLQASFILEIKLLSFSSPPSSTRHKVLQK